MMSTVPLKGQTLDLRPPPSPIHIRQPRTRHKTPSVTNLTFPEVTPPGSHQRSTHETTQLPFLVSRPASRRVNFQRPWNTGNLPFATSNFAPSDSQPKANSSVTSLQDFYQQAEARREKPTFSDQRPQNPATCRRTKRSNRPRGSLPPLPPHLRRRFSPIGPAPNTCSSQLEAFQLPEELDSTQQDSAYQEDPGISGRFRHPRELQRSVQRVESCAELQERGSWPRIPAASLEESLIPASPLSRSASLSHVTKMENMQARYLTDLQWRVCHAVNIYVYKNGVENQSPMLVHIPPAMKACMKLVLQVLNERLKYSVGYAKSLYKMDGSKVTHPCELEMYNNYVVASNADKHFKCVQYGRRRSPLLVLSPVSKHARAMKEQRERLRCALVKKCSSDELGYVCPRASMEVIGGIGCCPPTKIGCPEAGKLPERARSAEKTKLNKSRSRSKTGVSRSRSRGQRSAKSKTNSDHATSSRSPSPAVRRVPSSASGAMSQKVVHSVKSQSGVTTVDIKVDTTVREVKLNAVGGPLRKTDPKPPPVTINLCDLRSDDNNNNLVDAIIALQRSEHRFPPLSTGNSSYNQPTPPEDSLSKINNNVTPSCKSRSYSESDFEDCEDSFEESEVENDHKSINIPKPAALPESDFPGSSKLSPRGNTYTVEFETGSPSDPSSAHALPRAQNKSTSTSSLCCSACQQNGGVSTDYHAFPACINESNGWGKEAPPPFAPPPPRHDLEEFLLRKSHSHGFDMNFNIEPQNYEYEAPSTVRPCHDHRDLRHDLRTREFEPCLSDNEVTFDPYLEQVTREQCKSVTENNNYPPPPSPFQNQTTVGMQSSSWMYHVTQRRPETQGYTTYHLHSFVDGPMGFDVEESVPPPTQFAPMRFDLEQTTSTIPPPSRFANVTDPPQRRTVHFVPPPTPFADENGFWEGRASRATVTLREGGGRVRPLTLLRPRPSFAYPVEDFIFKKGLKSPLRQTVTRHVFPRRKSPGSLKCKQRFRR